jgi:CRP-like cAMP-binding protein
MIGAGTVRTLFALREVEPFTRLDDLELLLIAQHARPRSFPAGRVVLAAGAVADHLFVTVQGEARVGEAVAPAVFDAPGLLFGLAARADHVAGPDGLSVLIIAKPHVFTIARECPEFVVGLRELSPERPA